jgi:hypothetical protein
MKLSKNYNCYLILCSIVLLNISCNLTLPNSPSNEKKVTPAINFKVTLLPNKTFQHDDTNIVNKITKFEKCKLKSGIINFLKSGDNSKQMLSVTPIHIRITDEEISLYHNEKLVSLFTSIKLNEISHITQTYANTPCFNIVKSKIIKDESNEYTIKRTKIPLCGENKENSKEWMRTIQEFKFCSLNSNFNTKSSTKIIVDFEKVNELAESMKKSTPVSQGASPIINLNISNKSKQTSNSPLKELFYDNSNNSNHKSQIQEAEHHQLQKEVKNILSTIKQGAIAEDQEKRKLNSQLKEAKQITKEIEKKKEFMKKSIENKSLLEQKKINIINTHQKKNNEILLLKAVTQKLKSLKDNHIKKVRKEFKKNIQNEKLKANTHAQGMTKLIEDKFKLKNWDSCTSRKLLFFENKEYVNEICITYFGDKMKKNCSDQNYFCKMCCEFHIGVGHLIKRLECKDNCNKIIKGEELNKRNKKKEEEKKKDDGKNKNLDKEKIKNDKEEKIKEGKEGKQLNRKENKKKSELKTTDEDNKLSKHKKMYKEKNSALN